MGNLGSRHATAADGGGGVGLEEDAEEDQAGEWPIPAEAASATANSVASSRHIMFFRICLSPSLLRLPAPRPDFCSVKSPCTVYGHQSKPTPCDLFVTISLQG